MGKKPMPSAPPTLITPGFLLPYPAPVSDYRCAVNADATAAILERTTFSATGPVGPQLCLLDLTKEGAEPTFLLPGIDVSTRPDWSWTTGRIAFNYTGSVMVGVLPAPGQAATLFGSSTAQMNYPTWFPDGTKLATEDDNGTPSPNTTTIDASTGAICETALEGAGLWGGMPSVNPASPNLIAFAGQPVSGPTYNQDQNYIYVMDTSSSDPPAPLEPGAPASGPFNPNYQGRAPWWSPDGKWVVFESNRPSQYEANGLYAIYLYHYGGSKPAMQVTSTIYNCNHAKWFPNGFPGGPSGPFQLIVASWRGAQSNPPEGPYGLSALDLTPLGITF
jgi:Tol biopolymer transport system component